MRTLTMWTLAAALAVASGVALADKAETKGGLKIKSDDGNFEAGLGGRVQVDYSATQEDTTTGKGPNGFFLRRAYITLSGKLYGFSYKIESDIKGSSPEAKDMWLGHDLFGGFARIGHMQTGYGMELLTSSNDVLFTERPFISDRVIYASREFQNGVSWNIAASGFTGRATYYTANPAQDKSASANPNDGKGYTIRLTYAPLLSDGATLHVGATYDHAGFQTVGGGVDVSAPYVAKNGPSLALITKAEYDTQNTFTGELAGAFGPAFFQAEYANAKFEGDNLSDQTLDSYYVQASVFVTGESKPYKKDGAVFGNPKPKHDFGAVELKARYDYVKNKDAATEPKATTISFGANYYFNPNVRFMLDYNLGKAETSTTEDKPKAIVARAQIAF